MSYLLFSFFPALIQIPNQEIHLSIISYIYLGLYGFVLNQKLANIQYQLKQMLTHTSLQKITLDDSTGLPKLIQAKKALQQVCSQLHNSEEMVTKNLMKIKRLVTKIEKKAKACAAQITNKCIKAIGENQIQLNAYRCSCGFECDSASIFKSHTYMKHCKMMAKGFIQSSHYVTALGNVVPVDDALISIFAKKTIKNEPSSPAINNLNHSSLEKVVEKPEDKQARKQVEKATKKIGKKQKIQKNESKSVPKIEQNKISKVEDKPVQKNQKPKQIKKLSTRLKQQREKTKQQPAQSDEQDMSKKVNSKSVKNIEKLGLKMGKNQEKPIEKMAKQNVEKLAPIIESQPIQVLKKVEEKQKIQEEEVGAQEKIICGCQSEFSNFQKFILHMRSHDWIIPAGSTHIICRHNKKNELFEVNCKDKSNQRYNCPCDMRKDYSRQQFVEHVFKWHKGITPKK